MRVKVMSSETRGEAVTLTVVRPDTQEAALVLLPAWMVDYLGVSSGDVLSVCREWDDPGEGRRVFEKARAIRRGW